MDTIKPTPPLLIKLFKKYIININFSEPGIIDKCRIIMCYIFELDRHINGLTLLYMYKRFVSTISRRNSNFFKLILDFSLFSEFKFYVSYKKRFLTQTISTMFNYLFYLQ